jgi:hypothetical protein
MRVLLVLALALLSTAVHADDASVVPPPCANPARLDGTFQGPPGYFITFKHHAGDPTAVAAALAKKYHFKVTNQYSWGAIFVSQLTARKVAELRCAREVEAIEFNGISHPTARGHLTNAWSGL